MSSPKAVFNSAFGEYPMEFFPIELVERLVRGTSYESSDDGEPYRVLNDDALAAMKDMETMCFENWKAQQK
jgi:hypothetical protein